MIFRTETNEERWNRIGEWHRWFAWYPVSWDGGWAWFHWVETSCKPNGLGYDWFYRPCTAREAGRE